MAEPRIQYATTSDDISIAYWTMGEGEPPLVYMALWPYENCQLDWDLPVFRPTYELLASHRQLVRFDGRGAGLSQRDVTDLSLEARVLDLEAVVDRLQLRTFALFGTRSSGQVAIAYAARHPDRLSHLILWETYAGTEYYQLPQVRASRSLMEADWDTATETIANLGFGWSVGEQARTFAAYIRDSATPETAMAAFDARSTWDVTEFLPQIQAPTLVAHNRGDAFPTLEMAKDLASRIPNAELRVIEYDRGLEAEVPSLTMNEFLGTGPQQVGEAGPSGLVTILFTDLASSTSLTQQLGDAGAQEVRRAHNEIVRSALSANAGSEIKHTGDGIMASFSTASSALSAAIAIQRGVEAHNVGAHGRAPLHVYVGLNAGEPIAEDDDFFGTSINLAARICDHAQPGQILASDVVRQLAAGKDFLFADLGETELTRLRGPGEALGATLAGRELIADWLTAY